MIPIDQSVMREGPEDDPVQRGNCFQACVASILELPLAAVPHVASYGELWREKLDAFLTSRGLWFMNIYLKQEGGLSWPTKLTTWCILSGPSPRGKWGHACIGKLIVEAGTMHVPEVIHDPHPSRDGLTTVDWVGFIIPTNPANIPVKL